MSHRSLFFVFLFSSAFQYLAAQNTNTASAAVQPVPIPGSQLLSLTSQIVKGQEYTLHISLPGNYSDSSKTFPVLYLLDSQWDFPLVYAINGGQFYDGFVPGIIIVGITWGGKDANAESLRGRDFTPTRMMQMNISGGAPQFLSFIKTELIPFVEARYRTKKDDRILMGSSLGGLFTLYTLFHETDLFKRYVLTSPSIWWDNELVYKYEKEYAAKRKGLPAKLFMAHGEAEGNVEAFQKWVDQLKMRNYKGLEMQTRILENTGHSGTKPEGYVRGLQWVFARPVIKLPETVLKQYVGKYVLGTDTVTVSVEKEALVGTTSRNEKAVFSASSEEEFYSTAAKVGVRFKKENNKVTGFVFDPEGKAVFARKIN